MSDIVRCPDCKSLETEVVQPVIINNAKQRLVHRCRECRAHFEPK